MHAAHLLPPALRGAAGLALAASLSGVGLGVSPCFAVAQFQAQALPAPADLAQMSRVAPIKTASAAMPKPGASATAPGKVATRPLWHELTPAQQQALAPLAATWNTVSEAQKRKWLALSQNFPKMAPAEQAKLHSRMTDWAALSPQQRTQARLNFGETKQLSPDDKKAKWEAYQALPAEEKRKLAAGVTKPPATAAAVKPVKPEKLATVPKPNAQLQQASKTPRIAAAPDQVDRNTLLPQPTPPRAPAPVN